MRVASAALLLLAALRDAAAVNIDVENGVYKLQEATFDTVVKRFPAVMVKFYAPWCGHCKAMAPAYEKAARKLKKAAEATSDPVTNPRLAKVDATEEKELAKKYEVKGFPHMAIFKDGEFFAVYYGGRDKDDIVGFMQSFNLPEPLGALMRAYLTAQGSMKEAANILLPLPKKYKKYTTYALPMLLVTTSLFMLSCICCCRGSSKKRGSSSKRGRPAAKEEDKATAESDDKKPEGLQKRKGRSASPGKPAEKEADAGKAEGEEEKTSNDAKDE